MAHGILGDLHEHPVACLERELDASGLVAGLRSIPVDLAGVEHRVAATADVDERRLHAGEDVLDAPEVHIPDQGCFLGPRDVVLDENLVFEDTDLDTAVLRADDHLAVDGLASCEELGFGDHRTATARIPAVTTALLLGFEAGRALDALGFGDQLGFARRTDLDDGVRRVVRSGPALVARTAARTTADRAGLLAVAVASAARQWRQWLDVGRLEQDGRGRTLRGRGRGLDGLVFRRHGLLGRVVDDGSIRCRSIGRSRLCDGVGAGACGRGPRGLRLGGHGCRPGRRRCGRLGCGLQGLRLVDGGRSLLRRLAGPEKSRALPRSRFGGRIRPVCLRVVGIFVFHHLWCTPQPGGRPRHLPGYSPERKPR